VQVRKAPWSAEGLLLNPMGTARLLYDNDALVSTWRLSQQPHDI
jgi:hypothetical protein